LQGDIKVESHTDTSHRFEPGSTLFIDARPVTVERSRPHKTGLVIRFDDVPNRDAAESLRGRILTVPREDVPPLPEGQFYHYQLIDMAVWSDEGELLGRVGEILEAPGNDVYVVRKPGERNLLIPALANVVLDVDLDSHQITVHLMDGLR
jgi:16S rRNA processing protein RimM